MSHLNAPENKTTLIMVTKILLMATVMLMIILSGLTSVTNIDVADVCHQKMF